MICVGFIFKFAVETVTAIPPAIAVIAVIVVPLMRPLLKMVVNPPGAVVG